MNKSKNDYDVYIYSGCAISDENGNFSGDVLSSGMFEVKGEFATLKEAKMLMAAAPEMLDMLKECKDVLDIYKDNFTVEIEDLINKAEGK